MIETGILRLLQPLRAIRKREHLLPGSGKRKTKEHQNVQEKYSQSRILEMIHRSSHSIYTIFSTLEQAAGPPAVPQP